MADGGANDGGVADDAPIDVEMGFDASGPPWVVSSVPAAGAVAVDLQPVVEIRFNEPIQEDSGALTFFRVFGGAGEISAERLGRNAAGDRLMIRPRSPLGHGQRVTLIVRNFLDLEGAVQTEDYEASFTVESLSNTTHGAVCVARWLDDDPSRPSTFLTYTSGRRNLRNGNVAYLMALTPLAAGQSSFDSDAATGPALVTQADNPDTNPMLDGAFRYEPTTVAGETFADGMTANAERIAVREPGSGDFCGRLELDRGDMICVFVAADDGDPIPALTSDDFDRCARL